MKKKTPTSRILSVIERAQLDVGSAPKTDIVSLHYTGDAETPNDASSEIAEAGAVAARVERRENIRAREEGGSK